MCRFKWLFIGVIKMYLYVVKIWKINIIKNTYIKEFPQKLSYLTLSNVIVLHLQLPTSGHITQTEWNFLHTTEVRIHLYIIVPWDTTVPGGSGTAVTKIPMGLTSLLVLVPTRPCVIMPFWVGGKAYGQCNSCSDKHTAIIGDVF